MNKSIQFYVKKNDFKNMKETNEEKKNYDPLDLFTEFMRKFSFKLKKRYQKKNKFELEFFYMADSTWSEKRSFVSKHVRICERACVLYVCVRFY